VDELEREESLEELHPVRERGSDNGVDVDDAATEGHQRGEPDRYLMELHGGHLSDGDIACRFALPIRCLRPGMRHYPPT
jgi:hypothetical protein